LLRKEILPYLSKYYKIIRSPDIKNKFLLKKILKKIQDFHDGMSELEYRLDKFNDETNVFDRNDKWVLDVKPKPIKSFIERTKIWLNILQFRYLTPITICLSEFSEEEAKKRERKVFWLSILISALIGGIITWGVDFCNDNYLEQNIEEKIINLDSNITLMQEEYRINFNILKEQQIKQFNTDNNHTRQLNTVIEYNKSFKHDTAICEKKCEPPIKYPFQLSKEEFIVILEQQKESGLSIKGFCFLMHYRLHILLDRAILVFKQFI
jgi:hypothetical protein